MLRGQTLYTLLQGQQNDLVTFSKSFLTRLINKVDMTNLKYGLNNHFMNTTLSGIPGSFSLLIPWLCYIFYQLDAYFTDITMFAM